MFLELLLGAILWSSQDLNSDAELRVNCDQVEIYFSEKPKGKYLTLEFFHEDKEFDYSWIYHVPMEVSSGGTLLLEPTEYWIEEIKNLHKIEFKIGKRHLVFPLKGSKKALNCDGDVAE